MAVIPPEVSAHDAANAFDCTIYPENASVEASPSVSWTRDICTGLGCDGKARQCFALIINDK
jgi:hypothetical protein